MIFQFERRHLHSFAAVFSLFSLFSLFTINPTDAMENMPFPTIRVNASGSAVVAPDMAVLDLQVVRAGKNARGALDINNAAMKNVMEVLKEAGIKDKDIQTSSFNIQPRYKQKKSDLKRNEEPQIIGYVVYNSLVVKVRDLKILGLILDRTVTLGVNSGGQVRFMNDDPSRTIALARAKAVKNAMVKAGTLAEAAGVKLGKLISISEDDGRSRQVPFAMRSAALSGKADFVPLAAGENSYSVTVNASWEINQ